MRPGVPWGASDRTFSLVDIPIVSLADIPWDREARLCGTICSAFP